MVPHGDDEPDRVDPRAEESSDARSRVFVWGEPVEERSIFGRLRDRFRRNEPRNDEPPPEVLRPIVGRRVTVPEQELPPDLTLEESDDPAPVAEAEARPRSEEDHGPGPLYRATLQLLPGRMKPLDPDIVREEIRFVRPTGREAVVTLGWAEDDPPDHITVNHPSVQDRHARMAFVDRRWTIESLVGAHPVRVNDEAIPAGAGSRELQSGDEVRLGDASFHFLMP